MRFFLEKHILDNILKDNNKQANSSRKSLSDSEMIDGHFILFDTSEDVYKGKIIR